MDNGRCKVLHYNCDKGLVIAGQVERRYGGGRVCAPMRLVIGDRATFADAIDVEAIAVETAKAWFRNNFPEIDPDQHLAYQVELKPGSEELASIFHKGDTILAANECRPWMLFSLSVFIIHLQPCCSLPTLQETAQVIS